MKFKNIAKVLGWTEEPETISEGLFLQPEEESAVDSRLEKADSADQLAEQLQTANATIAERDATITELNGKITAAATTEQNLNNRIAELEAKVTELGGQPSGPGTTLETPTDPKVETIDRTELSLNHPDHPVNVEVRKELARRKKKATN